MGDATNGRSPLHNQFEWNDAVAAHQHRLKQARDLMNHLGIEVIYLDGTKEVVHAFKHVEVIYLSEEDDDEERQGVYVPVEVLEDEEGLRQQVIADLRRRIIYWKNEARIFDREFGAIINAIRKYEQGKKTKPKGKKKAAKKKAPKKRKAAKKKKPPKKRPSKKKPPKKRKK